MSPNPLPGMMIFMSGAGLQRLKKRWKPGHCARKKRVSKMDNGGQDRTDAGAGCLALFALWSAIMVLLGIVGGLMYLFSVVMKAWGLG